jgi:hypothetical protein
MGLVRKQNQGAKDLGIPGRRSAGEGVTKLQEAESTIKHVA